MTVLLVWLFFRDSMSLSPEDYNIHKGVCMEDSEEWNDIVIPSRKEQFKTFTENAAYLGLLFAGKSEFPWIVDLRYGSTQPEKWSIGNLLTGTHVITTCRAVKMLEDSGAKPEVIYFVQYAWEYRDFSSDKKNYGRNWPKSMGGKREVGNYMVHHQCKTGSNLKTMSHDIGCIQLKETILKKAPFISYMPIVNVPGHPKKLPTVPFSKLEHQKIICLVGSIGRDYINIKSTMVNDFKVRFRVYWENWSNCSSVMDKICDKKTHDCEGMNPSKEGGREWVCMQTRAKMGTVCDHDRGAPVVCGDHVVGIVTFGALLDYCNDRYPMPFVVARLSQFQHFILARLH